MKFTYRPYKRRFIRPLQTSHGIWETREGIIVQLVDQVDKSWFGEIAPIAWFGSETLESALEFCHSLPTEITEEVIFSIPDELPACQFGFESALFCLPPDHASNSLALSALLPAGNTALEAWQQLWEQGYRTFKWKIAVGSIVEEMAIFKSLIQVLPQGAKLRLDANCGLSYDEANFWLWTCDNLMAEDTKHPEIEFIEQPLPPDEFEGMLELSDCYATKLALDESVAKLQQLQSCYSQGWRDVFVVKPLICGSPSRLRLFCQQNPIDVVFSSVFETDVGRQSALYLISQIPQYDRAVGFGVNHWFTN